MNNPFRTNQELLEEISVLKRRIHDLEKSDSEHQRAGEALRKSNKLLLEMINQVPGVLFQFYARPNGESGFYYISERSEQIVGLKTDLEGFFERFAALVIPEHRNNFIQSVEKAIKETSVWQL
jgi:hypothetical protein